MATRRIGFECRKCGEFFGGEGSFKKHRTGSYGVGVTSSNGVTHYSKHERRCLSQDEMLNKGLVRNDKGLWTTGESDASIVNKEEEHGEEHGEI